LESWLPLRLLFSFLSCLHPSFAVCSLKNYRDNRENGAPQDNPNSSFPSAGIDALDIENSTWQGSDKWPDAQGRYWWKLTLKNGQVINDFYWMKDEARGFPDKSDKNRYWFTVHHAPSNTIIEGFSQEKGADGRYYIRFTDIHCPAIRLWMRNKDINYLHRLQKENPALYAQEIKTAHPDVQKIIAQEQAEQEHKAKAEAERIKRQEAEKQARIAREKQMREAEERAKQEAERKQWAQAEAERAKQQAQEDAKKEQSKKEEALQRQLAQLQLENAALKQQAASTTPPSPAPLKIPEKTVNKPMPPVLSEDTMQQMALVIRYEDITLIEKLGEGAFGVVSQGRWHYEDVAVKKLHLQQLSENALTEFKAEAAIMARLRSDYIVTLKGVTLTPYALVMEYMRGGSLFQLLHSHAPLQWPIRHRLASDIAKGLAFLHRHQPLILHRDLKSHNVLLNEYQRAKLADFGLAKVRVESSRSQYYAQSSSKSVGTIPWMAPESLDIEPIYSEKSDIYAYGMVLWEIATRKMPYENVANSNIIINAVLAGRRPQMPEETVNPADPLPTSYKELIRVCWFQAPEKRPTAKEAIETLEIDNPTTSSTSSTSNSSSYSGFFSGFLSNFSSQK
jgi:hypothetical protein